MNKIILLLCSMTAAVIADPGTLTLGQALELARQNSSALRAAQINIQAAEQAAAASDFRKNPLLGFKAEGFGLDNDRFSEGEYSLGLKQTFQLGGKRKKDRAVALKAVDLAAGSGQAAAQSLEHEVRLAFLEVLYLQESGTVQAEQEELGRAFVKVAKRRLETGAGSELEVVQAELALEKIRFDQTCCLGELVAARERLASLAGLAETEMGEVSGAYNDLEPVQTLSIPAGHPALRRLTVEAELHRAEAQRARANDMANITLGAGLKYEAADDRNAFMASASMPLALFRRGRAEQGVCLQEAASVEAERDEMRRRLQSGLTEALALYKGLGMQADMAGQRLLPKAQQAYELTLSGYEAGRFSWIELITAQQRLADIRIQQIESLKEAHLVRIEIFRLTMEEI